MGKDEDLWEEIKSKGKEFLTSEMTDKEFNSAEIVPKEDSITQPRINFKQDKWDTKHYYNRCPKCNKGYVLSKKDYEELKLLPEVRIIGKFVEYVCYACGKGK